MQYRFAESRICSLEVQLGSSAYSADEALVGSHYECCTQRSALHSKYSHSHSSIASEIARETRKGSTSFFYYLCSGRMVLKLMDVVKTIYLLTMITRLFTVIQILNYSFIIRFDLISTLALSLKRSVRSHAPETHSDGFLRVRTYIRLLR